MLIDKREKAGINFNNDPNAFIEHSNSMDDILSDIEDYDKKRKRKVLIIFDDMISHVMSLCFLTQSYFSVPKDVRLNCTHYILFKLNSKRELQNIAINHSADINYKNFIEIYRHCTKEPFHFLTIDTTKNKNSLKILMRLYKI